MDDLVLPGDIIANELEYLNKGSSYVDDEGNIRSGAIGKVKYLRDKGITVVGKDLILREGDIVEGRVVDVKDKMILVMIKKACDRSGIKKRNYLGFSAIFVSEVCNEYLESIYDAAKIGDLVKAQISGLKPGVVDLSTKMSDFGVMLAFCSKCRSKMKIIGTDERNRDLKILSCEKCKNTEKRKTSKFYIY